MSVSVVPRTMSASRIEDQIEVCRRYAARLGFEVTATFNDRAISGSNSNRPGYQQTAGGARRGAFDVVIVEAVDRLARKLSDIASVHDELSSMAEPACGQCRRRSPRCMSACSAPWRRCSSSDLREKTKRGQLGRVLQGRAAAGKAFGYDVVEGD